MKIFLPLALFAVAVPLGALNASAQDQRSSITSFDRNGNPVIQYTSPSDEDIARDGTRSSITSFDRDGNPVIRYTSPPLSTAPNPNPGYQRFGYNYGVPGNNYYPYPAGNYGYTPPPYQVPLNSSIYGPANASTLTVIPLSPGYAYPAPAYPYYPAPAYPYGVPPYGVPPYGVPPYGYPAPGYGYPAPTYGYPAPGYGYGYPTTGYGTGSVYSQSTRYGISFGRGGFSASVGGSNYSSSTRTTVRSR